MVLRQMKAVANNPRGNVIGAGVTDAQVEEAVQRSGYPLQTLVARSLGRAFHVREEWSFIDSDTEDLRTLDILAERPFFDFKVPSRVRPMLDLLIECKQSDLPYVFFLALNRVSMPKFPALAGLFGDTITATTDDDPSTYTCAIQHALGLNKDTFIKEGPRHCTSLSKCMRKGKDLEISGAETFNGIVLPLVKAVQHLQNQEAPPSTAYYHDMHIALAVAVIDAPMIAVNVTHSGQELTYEPWLRVVRNQAIPAEHWIDRSRYYAIDVVHKEFFETYISDHVVPFAERVSKKALEHVVEIVTGEAFVQKLGSRSFDAFTEMTPRTAGKKATRLLTIGHHLRSLFVGWRSSS
jgi:hypothetical protein